MAREQTKKIMPYAKTIVGKRDMADPEIVFEPSMEWIQAESPVLLTFDDGPDKVSTPVILDILDKHEIKAVFFDSGKHLEKKENRQILRRIAAEGHTVGNHAYSHVDLTQHTNQQIRSEIMDTQEMLGQASITGRLFRPPFGAVNANTNQVLRDLGFAVLMWNVDPRDWSGDSQQMDGFPLGYSKSAPQSRR
jgi:peptidoglycan/xylan/chitin deacetylase (PgdA/CDA1 family)